MRAREFTMKDGYSFDVDQACFDRYLSGDVRLLRSGFCAAWHSTSGRWRLTRGNIGGANSHEFHVFADSGEDPIVYATGGDYAANLGACCSAARWPPGTRGSA